MSTRLVVASFWAFILIGLPFWWKTTEVYRANLPLDEIEAWRSGENCQLELPTTFVIHIPQSLPPHLQERLSEELNKKSACATFPVNVKWDQWIKSPEYDIEHLVNSHHDAPVGEYHVYIDEKPASTSDPHDTVVVGHLRTSVIQLANISEERISQAVLQLAKITLAEEFQELGQMACHADQARDKNDVNRMRILKYSPRYQITFSLMNSNPDRLIVDWSIRDAVKTYLYPMLKELAVVSNFTVDSQVQNYASLSMQPLFRERPGKPGYYYFNQEHLPHFINSAEWNLASTISSYPTINFILYIPSPDQRLWIHDAHQRTVPDNAFLIPRWGGVIIKNPPGRHGGHYTFDKSKLQPVMRIFVSQLRSLLGIQELKSSETAEFKVTLHTSAKTGVTLLEKDNLVRRRTVENIVNAASTLNSLSQLVAEIPNMVVLDEIALQVHDALNALQRGCSSLQAAEYERALQHSVQAIELAEKAFFNPTMVSMLYFPDEHKYAIYMPLFVPITVPLIMAVVKGIKERKQAAAAAAAAAESAKSKTE
ncbi:phosphatidylinositol-glycan biosynthesis class S protein [Dichotomocladium elegans]|nr:phosphatidylinositol-glycan biosynthesis class S protein [Dichotomocladium elegans]